MACIIRGICEFWGASWVLANMAPRDGIALEFQAKVRPHPPPTAAGNCKIKYRCNFQPFRPRTPGVRFFTHWYCAALRMTDHDLDNLVQFVTCRYDILGRI